MHTATGTLTGHAAPASPAVKRFGPQGIEKTPGSLGESAFKGALVGAAMGITIFGFLLWLAGVDLTALRYIALFLGGIAMFIVGGAVIAALWKKGLSDDMRFRGSL